MIPDSDPDSSRARAQGSDPVLTSVESIVEDLFRRATMSEPADLNTILVEAYAEIRALAGFLLRGEAAARTLQPTALAHEAYLRLARETRSNIQGREHLLGVAATIMRRLLIDYARTKQAEKRGGGAVAVSLGESLMDPAGLPVDILDLHRQLDRLAQTHPRKVQVVELLYFAGLTHEEAGRALGVTAQTVLRDWRFAKAWLWRELSGGRVSGSE